MKIGANAPLRGNVDISRFHEAKPNFVCTGGTHSQKPDFVFLRQDAADILDQGIDIVFPVNLNRSVSFAVNQVMMILEEAENRPGNLIGIRMGNEEGNNAVFVSDNTYNDGWDKAADYLVRAKPFEDELKHLGIQLIYTGVLPNPEMGSKLRRYRTGFTDCLYQSLPSTYGIDIHVYQWLDKPKKSLDYLREFATLEHTLWVLECGVISKRIQDAQNFDESLIWERDRLISLTPSVWNEVKSILRPSDKMAVQLMSNPVVKHGLLESNHLMGAFYTLKGKDRIVAMAFGMFGHYWYIIRRPDGSEYRMYSNVKRVIGDFWD